MVVDEVVYTRDVRVFSSAATCRIFTFKFIKTTKGSKSLLQVAKDIQ